MSFKRRRGPGKKLVIDVIVWAFLAAALLLAAKYFGLIP